jgi:hypothetical protein
LLASEASHIPLQEVQKEFRTHLKEATIEDKDVGGYKNPCLDLALDSRPFHKVILLDKN